MNHSPLRVIRVPAFTDNYLWLFHLENDSRAYVVDPGDAQPIISALEKHQLTLAGILITHHHPDHTAGIGDLLSIFNNRTIPVYGPDGGSVPAVTHPQHDGETLTLENGLSLSIFEVPGHTLDHIAYFASGESTENQDASQSSPASPLHSEAQTHSLPSLFCGDTLFAAGCGRLFEGTPAQMLNSLNKYKSLPDNTLVYCAHEYTLANLAFASAVEPENKELNERVLLEKAKRDDNQATIPTMLGLEKATNPFLRCHTDVIKSNAEQYAVQALADEEAVFAAVRQWKDNF